MDMVWAQNNSCVHTVFPRHAAVLGVHRSSPRSCDLHHVSTFPPATHGEVLPIRLRPVRLFDDGDAKYSGSADSAAGLAYCAGF